MSARPGTASGATFRHGHAITRGQWLPLPLVSMAVVAPLVAWALWPWLWSDTVARLLEDVGRLKERVLELQRHFGQASGDLEKLGLSADKITKRGLRIEQLDVEEPGKVAAEEAQLRLVQGR